MVMDENVRLRSEKCRENSSTNTKSIAKLEKESQTSEPGCVTPEKIKRFHSQCKTPICNSPSKEDEMVMQILNCKSDLFG